MAVHLCQTGSLCLNKLAELQQAARSPCPTLLLIDVPYDEEQRRKRESREPRTPSPTSFRTRPRTNESLEVVDIYGLPFLTHITAEIHARNLSRMIIPVVVLSGFEREWASSNLPSPSVHEAAFMAQKRNRKLSWVGIDETKPYAYLREAMVSNLMEKICNPGSVPETYDPRDVEISSERSEVVADCIGSWSFSAHEFTDTELLHAALLMLQHALNMPEVEKWRMSTRTYRPTGHLTSLSTSD